MELTINIKESSKFDFFIKLINEFSFVEIIDIKKDTDEIPLEHKKILEKRLERIANGEATFKSWDSIKKKYEKEVV